MKTITITNQTNGNTFTLYGSGSANQAVISKVSGIEYSDVDLSVMNIAGGVGAVYINSKAGKREWSIRGALYGDSTTDLFELRRDLIKTISQDGSQKLFTFTTLDDLSVRCWADVKSFTAEYGVNRQEFLIQLVSADFRLYSSTETSSTFYKQTVSGGTPIPTPIPMNLSGSLDLSGISDNFNDNSVDTSIWDTFGTSVSESGGLVDIDTQTTAEEAGYKSVYRYNLTSQNISIQVVGAGDQSISSFQNVPIRLELDDDNWIDWVITGNSIKARSTVSATTTNQYSAGYNGATHKYFRIREASGYIYWDYSADASTWNNVASISLPFDVTSLRVYLIALTTSSEASTTTSLLDNLSVASGTGVAPYSTVVNNGDAISYPTFVVNGAGTTFTVTNETTGQSFVLGTTLTASEYITVDSLARTVTRSNGQNGFGVFSGDFIYLIAGNNYITVTTETGGDYSANVVVTHRDAYSGL